MRSPLSFSRAPALALLLSAASGLSAHAAPRYTATPVFGITPAYLNSAGQVLGAMPDDDDMSSTLGVWQGGTASALPLPALRSVLAADINDAGQVLVIGGTDGSSHNAYVWNGQTATVIQPPAPGMTFIPGGAIGADGSVPGLLLADDGAPPGAVLWRDGAFTPLAVDVPGAVAVQPHAVNARGDIAAMVIYQPDPDAESVLRPGFMVSGVYTELPRDLISFPSAAVFLNEAGEGAATTWADDRWGFASHFVKDGRATNLGALPDFFNPGGRSSTQITDLNNLGQVVGMSGAKAFLWSEAEGLVDLNTLVAGADPENYQFLMRALSINDRGEILAEGALAGLDGGYFLLSPVPEPSSALMAFLGVLAIVSVARRKA